MINSLSKKVVQLENEINNLKKTTFDFVSATNKFMYSAPTDPVTSPSFMTAICVSTADTYKQNRIKYFSPLVHNPYILTVSRLPWAYPISAMGGFDDCGLNWVPPAGSTVCILFEDGSRGSGYYIGTTWNRLRSLINQGNEYSRNWGGISIPEFQRIWEGNRTGYLVGDNTGAQVLPPWNTENYNGFDITDTTQIETDPDAYKRMSYPNIYGFKTPEKHMLKMVDGDPICNRKWKRIELMSGCGGWFCMKDDFLHYGGQWSNPQCTPGEINDINISCLEGVSEPKFVQDQTNQQLQNSTVLTPEQQQSEASRNSAQQILKQQLTGLEYLYNPSLQVTKEKTECVSSFNSNSGGVSNPSIIGGHPRYPNSGPIQGGKNIYFKAENECRPYRGPQTPQNNRCDLPQSGMQHLSISGHSFVMDDSVQQPRGIPNWQRSTQAFDYGCNDWYVGRTYWASSTGHFISMDDAENPSKVRSASNGIFFRSALGNAISMIDETLPADSTAAPAGKIAGPKRGIYLESTSKHEIQMCDDGNDNPPPVRKRIKAGETVSKASGAYVRVRSGYGLLFLLSDGKSQEKTDNQAIILLAPQKDNTEMGPHIFEMRESTDVGLVFLRAGGQYIKYSVKDSIEVVGETPENQLISTDKQANRVLIVSKDNVVRTFGDSIKLTRNEIVIADEKIVMVAGNDCKDKDGNATPCIGRPLLYMQTGENSGAVMISDKIIMSVGKDAKTCNIACFAPFTDAKIDAPDEKAAVTVV